jgi:hypothetical protein
MDYRQASVRIAESETSKNAFAISHVLRLF